VLGRIRGIGIVVGDDGDASFVDGPAVAGLGGDAVEGFGEGDVLGLEGDVGGRSVGIGREIGVEGVVAVFRSGFADDEADAFAGGLGLGVEFAAALAEEVDGFFDGGVVEIDFWDDDGVEFVADEGCEERVVVGSGGDDAA